MNTPVPTIAPVTRPARGLPAGLGGDERLARLVAAGHERAFTTLYERYHQRIYRYVRAMLRHDSDAQDVLQSVFARAFVALGEGRRDAPLRPWLYRIAHNEAISAMRRRRPEVDLASAPDTPAPAADEVAGDRARLALLVADLQALTERQRGALVMRELAGLSHEEIEAALQLDPGAAKQTIFEARRSLAEFSQGRAMSCDEICRTISAGSGRALRGRRVRAHLRDCDACQAFAAAIAVRSRDLRAIAPPLPAAAAAGLLAELLTPGGHGASGAAAIGVGGSAATTGAGASGAGAVAGGKLAALGLSAKVMTGVAVVAVAAGAGGAVVPLLHHDGRPAPQPATTSKLRGRGAPAAPTGAAGFARPAANTSARPPAAAPTRAAPQAHAQRGAASSAGRGSAVSVSRSHGAQGARSRAAHRTAGVHGQHAAGSSTPRGVARGRAIGTNPGHAGHGSGARAVTTPASAFHPGSNGVRAHGSPATTGTAHRHGRAAASTTTSQTTTLTAPTTAVAPGQLKKSSR